MSAFSSTESAVVRRAASAATTAREYLSLRLGSEEYGIDILRVQEIRSYEKPTRIAGASDSILGVLNLRGVIVPIIDLRLNFGIEPRFDAATITVVLNIPGRTVAVVVDSVSDVVGLVPEQVKAAPAFNALVDTSHITGIATLAQGDQARMLILLDIAALLASANLGLEDQSVH